MEFNPAVYGWAVYDRFVADSEAVGLRVLFATPQPSAPFTPAAYVADLRPAVLRYAGRHLTWELINEPDYFSPKIGVKEIGAIEKATAQAIHVADSSATVLTGGTSGVDAQQGFGYAKTLAGIVGGVADGIGIHPYISDINEIGPWISSISATTGKTVYVTEYGNYGQSMLSSAYNQSLGKTPLFCVYEYKTESGERNFGLLNTGAWSVF
jgi:hypothetical protein